METQKKENSTSTGTGGASKNYVRAQDMQQIGVGLYTLLQGPTGLPVGQLLVVAGTGPNSTVEHWGLSTTYTQPSSLHTKADIQFEYTGTPINVDEFVRSLSAGTTYIIASCTQRTI